MRQFSEDFKNSDSLALAKHYASDGTFGSVKREDLASVWGSMIRNAVKRGTPEIQFTANSLFNDGEYLIEIGLYEFLDKDKNVNISLFGNRKMETGKCTGILDYREHLH